MSSSGAIRLDDDDAAICFFSSESEYEEALEDADGDARLSSFAVVNADHEEHVSDCGKCVCNCVTNEDDSAFF